MKKILVTLIILMFGLSVFAGEKEDALKFFNRFLSAYDSNKSTEILNMYSNKVKFVTEYISDGKLINTVTLYTPPSIEQIEWDLEIKKIYKYKYKKIYTNIFAEKVSNGYKINATKSFPGNNSSTKIYIIIQKQPDGKWLIIEEMGQLTAFYR